MSKLDELIAELCPNGVEYKKVEGICVIKRGVRITKKDLTEDGMYPVMSGGTSYMGRYKEHNRNANTITISSYGAAGYVGFIKEEFWANDVCLTVLPKEDVVNKYLYYVLKNNEEYFYSKTTKAIPDHIPTEVINDLKIPVPPLEVQREIVRILDNFTELTAELTARKQQYKVYCRKLIEELSDAKDTCIGDLGSWSGGATPSMSNKEFWEDGTFPWVSSKDMKVSVLTDTEDHVTQKALDNTSIKLLPTDVVAIVARSGILKHTLPIVYIPVQVTVNQDIKALVCKEGVLPKYVFFALQGYHDELLAKTKKQGGTVDSLEIKKFMDFKIPVPSYKEQQRIVDILTRFDTLCNDISSGLPAEIEARRKQYEYYRDKLLTFKALA